jgi:pimeloyl-ACP methyl ester carboxylesterase
MLSSPCLLAAGERSPKFGRILGQATGLGGRAPESAYDSSMTRNSMHLVVLFTACSLLAVPGCLSTSGSVDAAASSQGFDPASSDRPVFDAVNPPRIIELSFESGGSAMNAIVYEAQGRGPHPTVVLLHGFPGSERNLDLAQAIRRAGWNVVFFHYRGAWGSGGEFSFKHVIEDVGAVVEAISTPEFSTEHRIDPERIALVGHSMGGFAALIAGAGLPRVDCIVSLAGANLGGSARSMQNSPETAAGYAAALDSWSGPINGPGGAQLVAELAEHADQFDSIAQAGELAKRDLLLVSGERDVFTPPSLHHDPLVAALIAVDAPSVETFVFEEGDHSFSGQRIALARLVTGWLQTDCATPE